MSSIQCWMELKTFFFLINIWNLDLYVGDVVFLFISLSFKWILFKILTLQLVTDFCFLSLLHCPLGNFTSYGKKQVEVFGDDVSLYCLAHHTWGYLYFCFLCPSFLRYLINNSHMLVMQWLIVHFVSSMVCYCFCVFFLFSFFFLSLCRF